MPEHDHDVIVLGAGAAGLMCAAVAGKRGRSILVLEQARRPGEKSEISSQALKWGGLGGP